MQQLRISKPLNRVNPNLHIRRHIVKFKSLFISFICFVFLFSTTTYARKTIRNPKELTFPPLHEIKIPSIQTFTLSNGMKVFVVEDHTLPLVYADVLIGLGNVIDPPEKIGLLSVYSDTLEKGGSKELSGDAFDEFLETRAIRFSVSASALETHANISSVSDVKEDAFRILARVLQQPAFPEDILEQVKIQHHTSISRRNDEPSRIAFREFRKLIYGKNHPLARHPEHATIDAITKEDLVRIHNDYVYPGNIRIAIWGDITPTEARNLLEKYFGTWNKTGKPAPEPPRVRGPEKFRIAFVRKKDVNQSTILIGHLGSTMDNPDYFALQIMNEILGGFSGWLFSHVRSDKGLAYAVFGRYGAHFAYPGIFYAGCMTKSESTVEAIRAILHEIDEMKAGHVTEEDLKRAKESWLNAFVFNFEDKGDIISRALTYDYYGYPPDFLEKTKEAIEKVTLEDVQRVARTYLHPDIFQIIVVGNDADFDEPLSVLGHVEEIDITIPDSNTLTFNPATEKEARAHLLKMFDTLGGLKTFQNMKSLKTSSVQTQISDGQSISMDIEALFVMPDKFAVEFKQQASMRIVLIGHQGYMKGPMGTRPLPPPVLKSLNEGLWRNLYYLAHHFNEKNLHFSMGSSSKGELRLQVFPPESSPYTLVLDATSYRPKAIEYTLDSGPMRGKTIVDSIQQWKKVGNIELPSKLEARVEGEIVRKSEVKKFEQHPQVDMDLFKMPEFEQEKP